MEEEKKEAVNETSESVDEEEKKKGGIVFINKFVEKHGKKNSIIYVSVCIAAILALVLGLGLGLGLKDGSNGGSSDSGSSHGGSSDSGSSHEHTFNMNTWSKDGTYHWHAATCGHDVVDGKAEHTFEEKVTQPTEDEGGYTTHVCTVCEYSYVDSEVPSIQKQEALGMLPVLDSASKTITYGLYPQTYVSDADTVTALNALTTYEKNGWYLYNGEYYDRIAANPYNYGSNYTFNDGTEIKTGTNYWFKCETITWKILATSSGTYSLLSNIVLDTSTYNFTKDEHTYENSTIRKWLNKNFYKTAFGLNNSYITPTDVDNSAATTESDTNPYASENTKDNVYLLSYKDYLNTAYGFPADDNFSNVRKSKVSDYAIANKCFFQDGGAPYWTRSPIDDTTGNYVNAVSWAGSMVSQVTTNDYVGVRPSITLNLSSLLG